MKIEDASVVANRIIFARLAAKFTGDVVKRRNQGGRELLYITARTAMNRLDEVLGPENWWDDYTPMENAVICRLTIRLPDGHILAKCDAGGFTTTADSSDYEKSGFSDAFKRACVKFGVGRYLYGDGVPSFASESDADERRPHQSAQREYDQEARRHPYPSSPPARSSSDEPRSGSPRTGKALFAWVKEREEKTGSDLLRSLNDWGKSQGYPARMVQWNDDEVHRAHAEALRLLDGFGVGSNGHAH